jgi:ketosteroid isomerase-like protein
MNDVQAQAFVARFTELWKDPDPDGYADLWHNGGVLRHPTMGNDLQQEGIPDYVRRLKAIAPDISLSVERWAASEDAVLIEWTLRATFRGESIEVPGVDRFTLRGDRATEGVAYFDTMPLWGAIDPSLAQSESFEERAQAVVAELG